ncbi:hypothetical protein LCGC14_2821940, partial [marine sediment metagenome]
MPVSFTFDDILLALAQEPFS